MKDITGHEFDDKGLLKTWGSIEKLLEEQGLPVYSAKTACERGDDFGVVTHSYPGKITLSVHWEMRLRDAKVVVRLELSDTDVFMRLSLDTDSEEWCLEKGSIVIEAARKAWKGEGLLTQEDVDGATDTQVSIEKAKNLIVAMVHYYRDNND